MTVQNTTDKAGPYAGAGTKGPFAVGFRFLEETHLQVIKTDPTGADTILALTTDYTVAGVDNESGGSVTLTASLPAGYKLTVLRNVPATQLADYVDGDSFPAESHERALDKLTMISQQLTEQVSRAAKLPVTSAADAQLLTNNIMRLANSANNIDTVAGSVGAVDIAAENMPAIIDAPAQAQAAANSAQAAGESAGDAAQTYTDFDKRYLGSKSADPSTDNQGGALLAGALYWNSSSGAMRVYGTAWSDVAQGVSFPYQTFSGTGTQTAFTLSGAPGSLGSLEVFISGVRQVPVTNYTLSGTTITFVTAPPSGTNNVFARWVTTQAINVPAAGSVAVAALKEDFVLPIENGGTGGKKGAGYLFEIHPHNGPIETIEAGFIPANGQKWYAALYPDAAAALEAGKQFMVSDVTWTASDTYKGCWSSGGTDEGGRWYRAPKLNADTGYRAPFLRGSQVGVDAGKITDDRIRDWSATIRINNNVDSAGLVGGVEKIGDMTPGVIGLSTVASAFGQIKFSLSKANLPIGPENSPRYHGVIMCIRMFGTVSNPGSLDAAQLATDLAVARAEISALQNKINADIGFTIIYPNGGTAAAPANVAINSRYVSTSPFPNYQVMCVAELLVGGVWADPKFTYANGGVGVGVSQVSDGTLVLQTGSSALTGTGNTMGSSHSSVVSTPTPCRVKVWKVKGSAA